MVQPQQEVVEDLVFTCLERLATGSEAAFDDVLAGQSETVRAKVVETVTMLRRVGLVGEAEADGDEAAVPERFGAYRLLERIGAGAMGVVYRARRLEGDTGAELAVKILQPGLLPVRGSRVRFEREIAALRELDHAGICPIVDDGEHEGVPYFVMPLVPGRSLRELFAAAALSRDELLAAVGHVAEALHHAHERGFVHRDVKPGNIVVRPDGRAVLLDFGLARLDDARPGDTLTMSGGVVGTPAYIAPEQIAGTETVDRRADVYALGVVLYEGLTGRLPHEAATRESLYRQILAGEHVRPSRRAQGVPSGCDAVCGMALQRDRSRRYETARLMLDDIERLRRGAVPSARLPGPLVRAGLWMARYPIASGLVAALVVAAMVIGLLGWQARVGSLHDRARSKASDALRLVGHEPDRALAEALAAHAMAPGIPETISAVHSALVGEWHELTFPELDSRIRQIEFSPDGRELMARTESGHVYRMQVAAPNVAERVGFGGSSVESAAYSFPSGSQATELVAGTTDGLLLRLGQPPIRVFDADIAVRRLVPSPSRTAVLAVADRLVRVVRDGGEVIPVPGHGAIADVSWLDDRRVAIVRGPLASRPKSHAVQVWSVVGPAAELEHERKFERALSFVRGNSAPECAHLVLVVATRQHAWVWNLETDKLARNTTPRSYGQPIRAVGWSADGASYFLGVGGGRSETFSIDGTRLYTEGMLDNIEGGVVNPVFPYYVVGSNRGLLLLNSFFEGNLQFRGRKHVRSEVLAFSPDGLRLAASNWLHSVRVWQMFNPDLPAFLSRGATKYVGWEDGDRFALQVVRREKHPGTARYWNVSDGRMPASSKIQANRLIGFDRSPNRRLAVASSDAPTLTQTELFVRDGWSWRSVQEVPRDEIRGYCFYPRFVDDDLILLPDTAGACVLWRHATGAMQRLPEGVGAFVGAGIDYVRWNVAVGTPGGASIWAGGAPGYLHRFDLQPTGDYVEQQPLLLGDEIEQLLVLPKGHGVAVGGANGMLVIVEPDRTIRRLRWHHRLVSSLACTELDGRLILASGGRDGEVCLWRLDGQRLRVIETDLGRVGGLAFSADGSRLLCGFRDGAAEIWPVREADVLDLARRRLR